MATRLPDRPHHVEATLRPRGLFGEGDGFDQLPGEPIPGTPDRLVRVDPHRLAGTPFSISALGPIPDMLLQWGGFDPEAPWAPGRARGYRLTIHEAGPPLPPPPGWSGPWEPEDERWYSEIGDWVEDAQVVRWIHRNMGGRFGEEVEPWLKLQEDLQGRPDRLHLWLVVDGRFLEPDDLWLRLQPGRPGAVRVRWEWGDGTRDVSLRGPPEAPLAERLRARHRYASPPAPGKEIGADLCLEWRFGEEAGGGIPWDWQIRIRYLGYLDLEPLVRSMGEDDQERLVDNVRRLRNRLRCLPGDRRAPYFTRGAPCEGDEDGLDPGFLQPGAGALPALLRAVLPPVYRHRVAEVPRGGAPSTHVMRFRFSGSFPQCSAPLGAPPEITRLRGRPGRARLD